MGRSFFSFFWPAVCGLLIAAVVWLAAPDLLVPKTSSSNAAGNTQGLYPDDFSGPISYADAVQKASPAVVNIYTSKTVSVLSQSHPDPNVRDFLYRTGQLLETTQEAANLGTGVVLSREGYVITNEHVIANADQILIALSDGRTSEAEIVGVDSVTDLAVLKIDLDNLSAISIGDPDRAKVGDVVLAIGNAEGFQQTVTQGILSAKGRNLVDMNTFVLGEFLQTDAAINQGNSGGPLVDVYGDMIGINSRALLQTDGIFGLSFAIPADTVLEVFRDIIEHGKVIRGWLGVDADSIRLSDEASAVLGFNQALGVKNLHTGGPAHRAGLELGDLIFKVNGEEVGNGRRTSQIIADTAPGDAIDFEVLRGSQTLSLTVQVGLKPELTIN